MAIAPLNNSAQRADSPGIEKKNDSELSDALKKAVKKKWKDPSDDKDAMNFLFNSLMPLQDRRVLLNKESLGNATSAEVAQSTQIDQPLNASADQNTPPVTEAKPLSDSQATATRATSELQLVAPTQDKTSTLEKETQKLTKREMGEITSVSPMLTPSAQSSATPQAFPNPSSDVRQRRSTATQDMTQKQIDALAAKDNGTASGNEVKYNFSSWGGGQSVVISATKAGYKLSASDNQVKEIIDGELTSQGDSSYLGITQVESADKDKEDEYE